jgi:hypothetical protein
MTRELFHTLPFDTFRRALITHRLAPKSASEPFVWFADRAYPEMSGDEVCLVFDDAAMMDQLEARPRGGWRTKAPHRPFVFRPEHLVRLLVMTDALVPGVQAMVPEIPVHSVMHDRPVMLDDELEAARWVRPNVREAVPALTQFCRAERVALPLLVKLVAEAPIVALDDAHLAGLPEHKSGVNIANYANKPIEAPIVVERDDGRLALISGGEAIRACRAMGMRPHAVFVHLDGAEDDFDDTDLSAEADTEEDAAEPKDAVVKGKHAVINRPFDFRHEPHAPNARSVAKVDPSGYHGQHVPKGAHIDITEAEEQATRLLAAGYMVSKKPFKCRACIYSREVPGGYYCGNEKIRSPIDPEACCDHYDPGKGNVDFGEPH